jgi:hypothetical protein
MSETVERLEARVQQLERRLRRHLWIGVLLLLAALLAAVAFLVQGRRTRFTELDVERLNVVEPDGQLVLAMANTARLPDPLIAGKSVKTNRTGSGLIFFDGKGWEVGGLVYGSRPTPDGYQAAGHFSFDQFHNDQVVYLSYQDDGRKNKSAGLYVVDRAREPTLDEMLRMQETLASASAEERAALKAKLRAATAPRIFVGSENETAMVRLRDRAGRDRIRLLVDPKGVARMEFLKLILLLLAPAALLIVSRPSVTGTVTVPSNQRVALVGVALITSAPSARSR